MLIDGAARLRRARAARPAAGRDAALLGRARGRPQPRAAAGDPQRQPRARRADDGAPTASSCGASTPSRTSAAWTCSAPTRPARSPKASSGSKARTTRPAHPSADVLELAALQRGARDRPRQPARRGDPERAKQPDLAARAKARRDPVRLRPQARQRRRARPDGASRSSPRARFTTCSKSARARPTARALDAAASARLRAALRRMERRRASACSPSRRERLEPEPSYGRDDEARADVRRASSRSSIGRKPAWPTAIADLAALGVSVKVITGDSQPGRAARRRARRHAQPIACSPARSSTRCTTRRCGARPSTPTSSSRSIPNQKERIILALKKMGHVVGFLGDGVNDAPAMHAADTSLSVEQAVDVAREAADFVLLERDLDVIRRRHRRGPPDVREHAEVRPDDDEREPRQHGQHGGRVAVPAVPAAAGGPDPAQQLPLRRAGDRHRRRQRRSGAGRAAAALGHRASSAASWSSSAC